MTEIADPHTRRWLVGAVGAALVFLALSWDAARRDTPTVDEFAHVPAGCVYLRHGTLGFFAKNPPLMKMLMAVPIVARDDIVVPEPNERELAPGWGPWMYGYRFMAVNQNRYLDLFTLARLVVILVTLATAAILFWWARDLFGVQAASIAVMVFLLTPMVLAHGHLGTVDAASMFTLFLTMFLLRKACVAPRMAWFALAGLAWGVAMLVKFTAILLLPAIFILWFVFRARAGRKGGLELACLLACAVITINLGMGFRGSFRTIESYEFMSHFGKGLKATLPGWFTVPLPEAWVAGFDAVKRDTEVGEFGAFLNGAWSRPGEGWWYYDLVALTVKTPIALLLLFPITPWAVRRLRLSRDELAPILVPLGVLAVMMMGFNRIQIGIRYLLPIVPPLILLAASCARAFAPRPVALGTAGVVGWLCATAVWTHPSYVSHFNLLAGGEAGGHRVLLDSNIDWGQDLYRVKEATEALKPDGPVHLLYFGHVDPAIYGIDYRIVPNRPIKGVLAVSVNYLGGYVYPATRADGSLVMIRRNHLAWLVDHKPVARCGSIWIFDTR